MPTKTELLARVAELEAENTAFAAELGVARVQKVKSGRGTFKYLTALTKHDGHMQPFTPTAVDKIRAFYYKHEGSMERSEMTSILISQGFTAATVRTRISRLIQGIDESCFNPVIRERLGLIETADAE